jgi:serine/threonine protein kinase
MMKLVNHPNVMRIFDAFEGLTELYLVLEYVEDGELFDFLVNRGLFPPDEALAYFKRIVYGLNYTHIFSIVHRDPKPENIVIASLSPPSSNSRFATFAPPSLQLENSYGSPHDTKSSTARRNATDVWSCVVILYLLLAGRVSFDDKNVRTLPAKVKTGNYEIPLPQKTSKNASR